MPRKKEPTELALDGVLRAVDKLETGAQRLDVLGQARRIVERSLPKKKSPDAPTAPPT